MIMESGGKTARFDDTDLNALAGEFDAIVLSQRFQRPFGGTIRTVERNRIATQQARDMDQQAGAPIPQVG